MTRKLTSIEKEARREARRGIYAGMERSEEKRLRRAMSHSKRGKKLTKGDKKALKKFIG